MDCYDREYREVHFNCLGGSLVGKISRRDESCLRETAA